MQKELKEITICEVCDNQQLVSVLDLGLHPMCDDLVKIGDDRVCVEYPIDILFCEKCYTAHQRFQVPKHTLFPDSYHYRSRFTADVLNGMSRLVDSCSERFGGLSGKKILDIGCNDGSLLDFFHGKNAFTIGIEPTNASHDAKEKGHVIINDYLSSIVSDNIVSEYGKPDLITFTNVFAHIENLQEVIDALSKLMGQQTVLVIENHYLGSVLDGNQFDTFYHEHPRTYSYNSFLHIAQKLGVELLDVEFPSRYGGNIRVFLGHKNDNYIKSNIDEFAIIGKENNFRDQFAIMLKNIEKWHSSKKHIIDSEIEVYGKLRAKAFPGRAAILVKMLGLNEEHISAVYEKPGSMKIGHYLPGTRIPICSDNDLFNDQNNTSPILNLAWHISDEIKKYLSEHGYTGRVIDILSNDDFL